MRKIQNGLLIAIEGIDGTGKTSLAANLEKQLSERYSIIITKEPGDTPLGQGLRKTLLQKDVPVCNKAEFLLFATDRAQHFDQLILPSLKEGSIVISDRMGDSSLVYQGYGRNLDIEILKKINAWAMNDRQPDLVLYLRLPADVAYERMKSRNEPLNSFEKEMEFMHRLTEGFDTLVAPRDNVVTLDAQLTQEALTEAAIKEIEKKVK
jgi:dTMP kinase